MGYLYALAAALLFGMNGSATKVIVEAGITPAQLTFWRVASVTVIAGAILLVTNRRAFRITGRQLAVMAALGIFGVALLQWTYAVAVSLLPVGIALLLEYLAVLAVAVIARVVFKERVKPRIWTAIALVLIGLAVVAQIGQSTLNLVGVLFALAAAATLTVYFVVGERQVGATSPLAVGFWSMGFATVFWGVLSGWWEIDPALLGSTVPLGGNLEGVSVPLAIPLLWNAVLGSFAPFLLSLLALKHLTATAAGITASSEVLFAFGVAWLWLGETLTAVQLLGVALVTVGIVLAQTARTGKVLDADLATGTLAAEKLF
ncbi:DMT family transporter [Leifsonia sp. YIM 134122]|uniref:DMT family transporter n=1 Tax=Leifsonia stereocauli TaxID=3134136 RepID=A0ABU9W107_9MICO